MVYGQFLLEMIVFDVMYEESSIPGVSHDLKVRYKFYGNVFFRRIDLITNFPENIFFRVVYYISPECFAPKGGGG